MDRHFQIKPDLAEDTTGARDTTGASDVLPKSGRTSVFSIIELHMSIQQDRI